MPGCACTGSWWPQSEQAAESKLGEKDIINLEPHDHTLQHAVGLGLGCSHGSEGLL